MIAFRELTTFRLGGPCARLIECASPDQLLEALRDGGPDAFIIGGGSNLLVAEAGLPQTVIRYRSTTPEIECRGEEIIVTGGTLLDDLARFAAEEGIEGLTSCSGIPGTVGGAVAGNAGAFGEQIGDVVLRAELIDHSGHMRMVARADLGFTYRRSVLQTSGDIVSRVYIKVRRMDRLALRIKREEILQLRAIKHPDWRVVRTAGSFFKNIEPTSLAGRRQAAGWFLEQAGAHHLRVGGARTFARHANIIVADDGARASDVLELSRQMAAAVKAKFGLVLQPEVRCLGF